MLRRFDVVEDHRDDDEVVWIVRIENEPEGILGHPLMRNIQRSGHGDRLSRLTLPAMTLKNVSRRGQQLPNIFSESTHISDGRYDVIRRRLTHEKLQSMMFRLPMFQSKPNRQLIFNGAMDVTPPKYVRSIRSSSSEMSAVIAFRGYAIRTGSNSRQDSHAMVGSTPRLVRNSSTDASTSARGKE